MTTVAAHARKRLHHWLANLGRRLRGRPRSRGHLLEIIQDARRHDLLGADALSMIEGVLQVSDLRVRDIMIPRAEMVALRRDDAFDAILGTVVRSAHSRFPVVGDDRGEVLGILLAKDLLPFCSRSKQQYFNLRDLMRLAVFVPESKRLNVLLSDFRASRNHMAIVVDEYGSAAGLVTIEDVIEQIVGEIDDEHDYDEGPGIYQRGKCEFRVKARATIEDFNEYFGTDFADEEYDTVGGLVVTAMGRLPERGEAVEFGGYRFTVVRADSRRVHMLKVERPAEDAPAEVSAG